MTNPAAGGNAPALPSRRRFLAGAAAMAAAATASPAPAGNSSPDAPFFALLAQLEKLDLDHAAAVEAVWKVDDERRALKSSEREAWADLHTVVKEVEKDLMADEARIAPIVATCRAPEGATSEQMADSVAAFWERVREVAEADPRCAPAKAAWGRAKERYTAFHASKAAPLEAAERAAWDHFDAAQRLVITYPVQTAEGLRAKLGAISGNHLDPHNGEAPNAFPAYDLPGFAALILADVERVMGAGR